MKPAGPQRTRDYLAHILEAIDNIRAYTAGATIENYRTDRKTQDAVLRNLEVIGEACNNVVKHHPAFAAEQAQVPWRLHMKCAMRWHTAISR